jgi:UDP-N-acetyl-D-mannosaminuronate dehydrogenase
MNYRLGLTDAQFNDLWNYLIAIRNSIREEGERGDLTVFEETIYLSTIDAMKAIIEIRRFNLRFPDDET